MGVLAIRQNCTFPFQERPFQSLGLSYRCFGFASQFQKITLPTDFGARFNTHSFNTSPKTHITGGRQKNNTQHKCTRRQIVFTLKLGPLFALIGTHRDNQRPEQTPKQKMLHARLILTG